MDIHPSRDFEETRLYKVHVEHINMTNKIYPKIFLKPLKAIGSMGLGMVDFIGKCREIYQSHGSHGKVMSPSNGILIARYAYPEQWRVLKLGRRELLHVPIRRGFANFILIISSWWFQVSTHLKNISQIGSFPQVGVKIKNI